MILPMLANNRRFRGQPHVRIIEHFLQHAVQLFPIAFAGIAIQAVRLHRLHPHFSIKENLVHSFRQFGQNDFSGPLEPFNISLVINQFNKHNRNQFVKLQGSALITEDGEEIEGDALDDVEVFGVLTHSLNRVWNDDCPAI